MRIKSKIKEGTDVENSGGTSREWQRSVILVKETYERRK